MNSKNPSEVAYVVQARLESTRVPGKMLRPFVGTTLVDLCLKKLLMSSIIPWSQLYFAVHEPELIDAGRRHGVNIFQRSERSMRSEGKPISELYEWWDKLPYRYVVLINACAPMLKLKTIDAFVKRYLKQSTDGLFGVLERCSYFFNSDGTLLTECPPPDSVMNTKFVSPIYEAGHCLYAGRQSLIGEGTWMGSFKSPGDPELYVIPPEEALDIDCEWDFVCASQLYAATEADQ